MSKCMAVNAGSSSIKYKLYELPEEKVICSGLVERIGHDDGHFVIKFNGEKKEETLPLPDHSVGVERILKALLEFKIIALLLMLLIIPTREKMNARMPNTTVNNATMMPTALVASLGISPELIIAAATQTGA